MWISFTDTHLNCRSRDLISTNTVYRSGFNFNRWEIGKRLFDGIGKLSLQYILKVHKVKFYYHLLHVGNTPLVDLFWL